MTYDLGHLGSSPACFLLLPPEDLMTGLSRLIVMDHHIAHVYHWLNSIRFTVDYYGSFSSLHRLLSAILQESLKGSLKGSHFCGLYRVHGRCRKILCADDPDGAGFGRFCAPSENLKRLEMK